MPPKPDKKPVANIAPFGLRMQPELKSRVEESAKKNNRSMNAEIIALIESALSEREQFAHAGADLLAMSAKMDAMAKVIRRQIGDEAADEIGL